MNVAVVRGLKVDKKNISIDDTITYDNDIWNSAIDDVMNWLNPPWDYVDCCLREREEIFQRATY